MKSFHIHITGQVQGVGFRPYVYQMAGRFGLDGWVNNTLDGVHIEITSEPGKARRFYDELIQHAPELAVITAHHISPVAERQFSGFRILHSNSEGQPNLLLTPDFALCSDCRQELLEKADRRFNYPFITCTNCGPRFSIVSGLPYDRERTTMDAFPMCSPCASEYEDPLDRRYYAQTNSCPECGIQLSFFRTGPQLLCRDPDEAIARLSEALKGGAIGAVKGIGGYLLVCDATNAASVRALRDQKARPAKPFALMYPHAEMLGADVFLSREALDELQGPVSPVVLLNLRSDPPSGIAAEDIAPGLDQIGAMLPYAPLFELLLLKMGRPIVATSGNVSGAPIVYEDGKALDELFRIADFILVNNRAIAVPQDDSVVRYSTDSGRRIVIRRSRGIAPTHLERGLSLPQETILAMGAHLKSTFALLHQKNTFVSQYLGKLDYLDTQNNYRHVLDHFLELFRARPTLVLVDQHPGYYANQLGRQLAERWQAQLIEVQHHEAHAYAVLAENELLRVSDQVLCVVWDGTGLGQDAHIWGGEFFLYQGAGMKRIDHFPYFPHILGDKMAREPRVSALAACLNIPQAEGLLRKKFTDLEWQNYQKLCSSAKLMTSSAGRLFDAAASLLNVCDRMTYEGEAAMKLEVLARQYFLQRQHPLPESYLPDQEKWQSVSVEPLLSGILRDIELGEPNGKIALRFHFSMARLILLTAQGYGIRKIALSGGVFQNELLVDLLTREAASQFELYFHQNLSPNDESVSYGQVIYYLTK